MKTTTTDHDDVLAAIALAAESCGREPQPPIAPTQPNPRQQAAAEIPFYQNQGQAQAPPVGQTAQMAQAAQANYAHSAFQPQGAAQGRAPAPNPGTRRSNAAENQGPSDEEMREVFAERKKKQFKLGLVVNMTLLALLVTPCIAFSAWYHSSPKNKESFAALMENFREVPKDVKNMANIKESYDEALGEIGARGDTVSAATLALGVDPAEFEEAAAENDDTAFLNEHAEEQAIAN